MDKILPIGKGGRLGTQEICFAYLVDIIIPSKDIRDGKINQSVASLD